MTYSTVFVSCRSNKHAVFELPNPKSQILLKKCRNQVYSSIKHKYELVRTRAPKGRPSGPIPSRTNLDLWNNKSTTCEKREKNVKGWTERRVISKDYHNHCDWKSKPAMAAASQKHWLGRPGKIIKAKASTYVQNSTPNGQETARWGASPRWWPIISIAIGRVSPQRPRPVIGAVFEKTWEDHQGKMPHRKDKSVIIYTQKFLRKNWATEGQICCCTRMYS